MLAGSVRKPDGASVLPGSLSCGVLLSEQHIVSSSMRQCIGVLSAGLSIARVGGSRLVQRRSCRGKYVDHDDAGVVQAGVLLWHRRRGNGVCAGNVPVQCRCFERTGLCVVSARNVLQRCDVCAG